MPSSRRFAGPALALLALAALPLAAPAAHHEKETKEKAASAPGTIVEVAAGSGDFDTLVAAVQAAGLAETLSGEGPFTVFAPTDAAFDRIPKEDLDALLADEEKLTAVLTYHVVPGRVMASEVAGLSTAKTVQGQELPVRKNGGGVQVAGANVVETDIAASNGVIHGIDRVVMPEL